MIDILTVIGLIGILGVVGYNIFTNNKKMAFISGMILIAYIYMI